MSNPNVLLLGPPGAGKGTQSGRIVERFGVEHVTTGDALRANKGMDISYLDLAYDTPGEYMDRGELVPDPVVDEIVETALSAADGFVLDGYPRNLDQAAHLDDIADLDVVLYLDVAEEELVRRLTGRRVCDDCGGELYQREDDTEATARERIQVYEDNTAPVVERYEERGDLVRVDGEGTPDEVWATVGAAIVDAVGD